MILICQKIYDHLSSFRWPIMADCCFYMYFGFLKISCCFQAFTAVVRGHTNVHSLVSGFLYMLLCVKCVWAAAHRAAPCLTVEVCVCSECSMSGRKSRPALCDLVGCFIFPVRWSSVVLLCDTRCFIYGSWAGVCPVLQACMKFIIRCSHK